MVNNLNNEAINCFETPDQAVNWLKPQLLDESENEKVELKMKVQGVSLAILSHTVKGVLNSGNEEAVSLTNMLKNSGLFIAFPKIRCENSVKSKKVAKEVALLMKGICSAPIVEWEENSTLTTRVYGIAYDFLLVVSLSTLVRHFL